MKTVFRVVGYFLPNKESLVPCDGCKLALIGLYPPPPSIFPPSAERLPEAWVARPLAPSSTRINNNHSLPVQSLPSSHPYICDIIVFTACQGLSWSCLQHHHDLNLPKALFGFEKQFGHFWGLLRHSEFIGVQRCHNVCATPAPAFLPTWSWERHLPAGICSADKITLLTLLLICSAGARTTTLLHGQAHPGSVDDHQVAAGSISHHHHLPRPSHHRQWGETQILWQNQDQLRFPTFLTILHTHQSIQGPLNLPLLSKPLTNAWQDKNRVDRAN